MTEDRRPAEAEESVARRFPGRAEDITAEWLSDVLGQPIASVELLPIDAGSGFMSEHARIAIETAADETNLPATLFVKLSSPHEQTRKGALPGYINEVRFYRELSPSIDLRTPRCYFADVDEQSGDSLLLLEDLVDARPGDILSGCSLAEAIAILREVGRFHAHWSTETRIDDLTWLNAGGPRNPERFASYLRGSWEQFKLKFRNVTPDRFVETCERALADPFPIATAVSTLPTTLTLGDCQLANVLFGRSDGAPVFIDFQGLSRAAASKDICWFLMASLPVDQRRDYEEQLLKGYVDAYSSVSDTAYSMDMLHHELQLAIRLAIITGAALVGTLDFSSTRGQKVADAWIQRASALAEDYEIAETLLE